MDSTRLGNTKVSISMGFTILESLFVILAVIVLAFILAGLYFKHNQLPSPDSSGGAGEITAPGPTS